MVAERSVPSPAGMARAVTRCPWPIRDMVMGKKDDRIDAYIAKSPDFAQPILKHIRAVVHEACPEVEETMKWSSPTLVYHGILCGMGAFKEHCILGFWKGSLILGEREGKAAEAAGQFGRITKIRDLPSKKVLSGYIKEAMELNENGVKPPARPPKAPASSWFPTTWPPLSGTTPRRGPRLSDSVRATSESMLNGLPRPRPSQPARGGSNPRLSGWPRESRGTGST